MNSTKAKFRDLEKIRGLLIKLVANNTAVPESLGEGEATLEKIGEGLNLLLCVCEERKNESLEQQEYVSDILEATMALAKLDYSKKAKIKNNGSHLDALASGVNMLGEELQASTISVLEKETLLKEIHHRIKNNLQLVSSLLNLQSTFINDHSDAMRLRESQDRIRSIALLHEKLYETKDLKRINFVEYLEILAQTLCETYKDRSKNIKCSLEVDVIDKFLTMDQALPCGLILNELLTNAFKYAFRKKKSGKITLRITQKKNEYSINLSDNGCGIPAKIDINNSPSLGLQLVHTLTEQLKGTLHLSRKNGTSFTVKFKV